MVYARVRKAIFALTGLLHLLGPLLLAAPVSAQSEAATSSDALVLVLNIISSTHARPVTGVVLSRESGGPALVLVPAQFVSAGDEIIVLDGGTDILRNGRATRTVARSAEAGFALLEVQGLNRPGVAVSADDWPPAQVALDFAAWPAADALAEGAPLNRIRVRLQISEDAVSGTEPQLPAVSGPLFNRCGHLAALHVAVDPPLIVGGEALVAFLDDSGFNIQRSACAPGSETTGSESTEPDAPAEEIAPLEPESPDFEEAEPGEADGDNAPGSGPGESTAPPMGEPETDQRSWLLAAAGTAVFALMVVLFLRRRRAPGLILKGVDQAGAKFKRSVRFSAPGQRTEMEHGGAFLHFELRGGQVFISDPGSSVPGVALIVNGTPCLPEESFRLHEGDKLQWGENRFTVRLKLDAVRK